MKNSAMVWCDAAGGGRNVFALFLRRFALASLPATLPFHLFADSLYRLRVNGRIIGFGPARFLPAYPEYDPYDLAPFLRTGENTVLVEINSRGAPCFQAVVSRGGFIAAGDAALADGSTPDLGTPGEWRVARADAWDAASEPFSFAQGPIENLDARLLPAGYPAFPAHETQESAWHAPTLVAQPEHWGSPSPRAIAMPSLATLTPERIILTAAIPAVRRHGFNAGNAGGHVRQPFFAHIFSETDREVELGVFWGPLSVNGTELRHTHCALRGNRQNARVALRSGWNFFYGCPELINPCWTWLMELPDEPGLLLRALPAADCPFTFGLGTPAPPGAAASPAPSSLEALPGYPAAWKLVPDDRRSCSPARELGWDLPGEVWQEDLPYAPGIELPAAGEAVTAVLDFGQEYLGHVRIEFETEHGATLDVGYDERLGARRTLDYYRSNPFVNSADRYVCGAGRQVFDAYHERGGRYLQLTFRGRPGRVRIRHAEICATTTSTAATGHFRCGDELLNWVWQTGVTTIQACTGDGWYDCPWRERGMYVGDVLVMAPATRKFSDDARLEPWAIRLWARAQQPGGQIPDVVPSAHETPLSDYTLLWVVLLRNHWAATGDATLVREVWPAVGRIFGSSAWQEGEEGLWETDEQCFVFVDWGVAKEERLGTNGVLNAFRVRALQCAAELAGVLGLADEQKAYRAQAAAVEAALCRVLWDEKRGRFAACRIAGRLFDGPSPHVNALALAYNLGHERQQAGVLAYLKDVLPQNPRCADGYLELYFLYFLLDGLYRVGEAALAESVMREHYRLLREHGVLTLPETLKGGLLGEPSLCHGWSAAPVIFLSERVLGVRGRAPGDPSRVIVAPEAETLDEAYGSVPHPLGTIRVAWRVDGGKLLLALELPGGVDAQVQPAGRLARLELVRVPLAPLKTG